jgi:hypothetical protein
MKKAQPKTRKNKTANAPAAKTEQDFTRDFLTPEYQAMLTEAMMTPRVLIDQLDFKAMRKELDRAGDEVNAGSMRLPERMVIAQAHTLHHLFNRLTVSAFENLGGQWFEPFMRLALRAQAQSAQTLQTLAALKSPAIFTKQLNVANQQVVNQGCVPPSQGVGAAAELREPAPIVRLADSETSLASA